MQEKYHILNGDSLKEQFPNSIAGKIIITRECLVDGDVSGNTLEEFYSNRAKFLSGLLNENNTDFYYNKTVVEFKKIQNIPEKSEINLWFEDDLFCQVNLWFIIYLLNKNHKNYTIYLIRPNPGNKYCFGNMSNLELIEALRNKTKIESPEISEFGKLWILYRNNDIERMTELATSLNYKFDFLLPAIFAFSELIPKPGQINKPAQTLIQIITEFKNPDFETVFKEFSKRLPIYGFGDLQVKRILDKINAF